MNACMEGCSAGPNQMLRLTVPDPKSWRRLGPIYPL